MTNPYPGQQPQSPYQPGEPMAPYQPFPPAPDQQATYPGQQYPGQPAYAPGQQYPAAPAPQYPAAPQPHHPGQPPYTHPQQAAGQQHPGYPQHPGQQGYPAPAAGQAPYPGQPQYPGQPPYPGQPTYPGQPQYPMASEPAAQYPPMPDPWGHDGQPPASGSSRKPVILAAAGVVAALVLGVGGWAVYDGFVKEDSGVAACKAMAADADQVSQKKPTAADDGKFSKDEYDELRGKFEDSRYDDIREHGTGAVNAAWQISQIDTSDRNNLDQTMMYIKQLTEHLKGLKDACSAQGVDLKINTGR
ncbi:hypothetical protein AB0H57_10200 [Micromonospora sp. NPDC050686]|uniref:hypothetical protein n=1 Tax=Micromonospora sp. NPDC050686 TaxID=3154631 RepID=UPI0033FF715B